MLAYYNKEINNVIDNIIGANCMIDSYSDELKVYVAEIIYFYDQSIEKSSLNIIVEYFLKKRVAVENKCIDLLDESDSSDVMSLSMDDIEDNTENCDSDFLSKRTDKIQLSSYKDLIVHVNDYEGNKYKEQEYINRQKIIKFLDTIPQHEQGTVEWLDQRKGCITATGVAVILDEDPNQYPIEIFMDKCGRGLPFIENIYVHHGKQYELIGNMFYSFRNNIVVGEYGLIQHSKYNFIGASPDGICQSKCLDSNKLSKRIGRLLEIKFPYCRKINFEGELDGDICPHYYFVQVQTQLFVTGMTECDFLQCKVSEYDSWEDYVDDSQPGIPGLSKKTNLEKGCMIRLSPKNLVAGEKDKCLFASKYIYQPKLHMTHDEIQQWISLTLMNFPDNELAENYVITKVIFWKLEKIACNLITYDKKWFESRIPELKQFWDYVEFYRSNPKKLDKLVEYVEGVGINNSAEIFAKIHKEYAASNKTKLKPMYQKENKWRKKYNVTYAYRYKKKNMFVAFKSE